MIPKLLTWAEEHPKTGWYIAIVVTVDFAVHILTLVLHA